MRTSTPPSQLAAGRGLLLLASRLLAEEIDVPLYRSLLASEGTSAGPAVVDETIRHLDEDQAVQALAVEFCRLFVGPRPVCPPYESVQRGEVTVGGRAESRMKAFMAREGVEVTLRPGLAVLTSDHLAVQLAVLHRLSDPARPPAAADTGGPEADPVGEFLTRHLLPWAPAYLRELQSASALEPYRSVAGLTSLLLTSVRVGSEPPAKSEEKGHDA